MIVILIHSPSFSIPEFLDQAGLINTGKLGDFSDTRIGIEVFSWMRQLNLPILESLQPAMGGIPISFEKAVLSAVESWKTFSITPLFVFQGLSVRREGNSFRMFTLGESRVQE